MVFYFNICETCRNGECEEWIQDAIDEGVYVQYYNEDLQEPVKCSICDNICIDQNIIGDSEDYLWVDSMYLSKDTINKLKLD